MKNCSQGEKEMIVNQEKLKEKMEMVEAQAPGKYDCSGCYSISIGDILVYVGKSKNILQRFGFHLLNLMDQDSKEYDSHKYKILREAQEKGYKINFNLLYKSDDMEEVGQKEGELIRKYQPILNYQIPKEEDYKKYTVNKKAKNITLEEILGQ